ncbi:MAG: DUF983 domain-containing protein [Pseudomonadota bacterium]
MSPPPPPLDDGAHRRTWPAIWRGMKKRCPRCGKGHLFNGYTKVAESCPICGQDFTGQRADDAPPYITMMIVGHALAIPIVEVKRHLDPPLGLQLLLWMSLATVMTLTLLPIAKGALIGLQWAQRMHGFGPDDDPEISLRP